MDSSKVLVETLEMLKTCQSNCDYIALSTTDENTKRLYILASEKIKNSFDTLQKIHQKSIHTSKGEGNINNLHRNTKNGRMAHHIQEITSLSVVDSDDVLRPSEIPEL